MLFEIGRDISLARLSNERKHGRALLERVRVNPSLVGTSAFDSEYLDWTESLAFAVNFASNGHADLFLETLGYDKHELVPGLQSCRARRHDVVNELRLYLSLLDKWFDRLVEDFDNEERVHLLLLDELVKRGGKAKLRALQITCQLEDAYIQSVLRDFEHHEMVFLDSMADRVVITDAGVEYHSVLHERRSKMAIPDEIKKSIAELRKDHPDPSKTGFVVMRFGSTAAHSEIVDAIRTTLAKHGLSGLRADDKEYHPDLYHNIMTYMHGCGFAIAVYERLESDEFNPNVALEVGGFLVMNKPVCLLKDKTLRTLNTDLAGKLYRPFDPQNPATTINEVLTKWLRDRGIA